MITKNRIENAVYDREPLREPLLEPGHEPARKNSYETDQQFPAVNRLAAPEEPGKRVLPLFSETLFKARDFDPL
jgi:hypothetical protein